MTPGLNPAPRMTRLHAIGWTLFTLVLGLGLSGCQLGTASEAKRGKELFQTCVPCHGPAGAGRREVAAPGIAGMSTWYIQQELHKFVSGARGTNFDDAEGMHMQPMALSLATDEDVKAVSQYVASLPQPKHVSTLGGDAKAGQALYATCIACHGANGEGNQVLKAPRVAGVEDWYLTAELRKFKSGVRGTDPEDQEGQMMHNMTVTLANDKAIQDVVAYIETLKP